MDWALAHQFSIGREADITLAPVLEISYKNITRDRLDNRTVKNTGETILYFSPGLKFTKSSLILEALAQIPVWQDQEGSAQANRSPN
jgi:predicted nicotinamide N-methyase